jgi:hypothetical protein
LLEIWRRLLELGILLVPRYLRLLLDGWLRRRLRLRGRLVTRVRAPAEEREDDSEEAGRRGNQPAPTRRRRST